MNPRRVVTGHNAGGRAVVVLDEIVHPVTIDLLPGNAWHLLGGADKILTFPNDGSDAPTRSYFPSVGGFRFRFITFPPDGAQPARDTVDRDAALREFEEKLPGMAAHMEPEHPGMHTTGTVDCGMIIAGEITLELDDGVTVNLKAGDTFVQNGTRHRWTNPSDAPATMCLVAIGAHHEGVTTISG
jgi:mannose-6-phosphate isomerase-like protein (cupin superfamily)